MGVLYLFSTRLGDGSVTKRGIGKVTRLVRLSLLYLLLLCQFLSLCCIMFIYMYLHIYFSLTGRILGG